MAAELLAAAIVGGCLVLLGGLLLAPAPNLTPGQQDLAVAVVGLVAALVTGVTWAIRVRRRRDDPPGPEG